jgi:hypothetical protein
MRALRAAVSVVNGGRMGADIELILRRQPLPRKLHVFLGFATPRFRARLSAGARG